MAVVVDVDVKREMAVRRGSLDWAWGAVLCRICLFTGFRGES